MTTTSPEASERLVRWEGHSGEFPFFNGVPISLSASQWLWVMAMVVVAFVVLTLPVTWPGGSAGQFIPAILFPLIPLAALAYVAPRHWRVMFGKVGARELRLMLGFALLNIVVSLSVGAIVASLTSVASNASTAQLADLDSAGKAAFFAKTLPQLLGEEVITLLPFLALLQVFSKGIGIGRRGAVIGAWLASSVMFGLIHLPTYDWNLIQCLVIIGSARMVLTLPWILTKNLWVSTGAHIVNDWLLFGLGILGAGLAAGA